MSYKQKHPETCLAKCMIIILEKIVKKKLPRDYEIKLLVDSFKYDRENISRGHIEKIVKNHSVQIDWFVDSKIFYNFTKRQKLSKRINLQHKKINLELIKNLKTPLIIYLDRYYLWQKKQNLYYKYHWPHFLILEKAVKKGYKIIDPDDGKVKIIQKNNLLRTIMELKYRLWLSPMIIQIRPLKTM